MLIPIKIEIYLEQETLYKYNKYFENEVGYHQIIFSPSMI